MSPVIQIGIDIDDQMTIECVIKKLHSLFF